MDADVKQKLWVIMQDMRRARDRFFIHYSGAGRDTDLRDELLVMEAAVKDALELVMKPEDREPNYELRITNYELGNSAPAVQDGRKEVRHG